MSCFMFCFILFFSNIFTCFLFINSNWYTYDHAIWRVFDPLKSITLNTWLWPVFMSRSFCQIHNSLAQIKLKLSNNIFSLNSLKIRSILNGSITNPIEFIFWYIIFLWFLFPIWYGHSPYWFSDLFHWTLNIKMMMIKTMIIETELNVSKVCFSYYITFYCNVHLVL